MVWVSSQSRIAYAREPNDQTNVQTTAFGGSASTGSESPLFLGITNQGFEMPDKTLEIRQYRSFGAGRRFQKNQVARNQYGPTSISFLPTTAAIFYYAFGTEYVNESSSPPTIHTLAPDDKNTDPTGAGTTNSQEQKLPSLNLSFYLEDPDWQRVWTGGRVNSLNWTLNEQGELSCSMDFVAMDVKEADTDDPTAGSPSPEFSQPQSDNQHSDPEPYMFFDRDAEIDVMGNYSLGSNSIDTTGQKIASVKSFNCSMSNNNNVIWYTRSSNAQKPGVIVSGAPDFSLTLEVVPDESIADKTDSAGNDLESFYHYLLNESAGDVYIPFKRDGSASDRLDFVFKDCYFRSAPHSPDESGNEISVSVEAVPETMRVVSYDEIAPYDTL